MLSTAVLLSLLATSFALPQGSGGPVTHQVTVGVNGTLAFDPEAIFANVGDTVIFNFHPKNHSVVQSSLANPCGKVDGGFNSGYHPVDASVTSDFPTATLTVTTNNPLWYFCSQGSTADPRAHCHAGMVFSINCGPTGAANSFDAFKSAAIAQGAAFSSSAAAAGSSTSTAAAAGADTTSYPGITIPPAPVPTTVTSTITLGTSTYTTTYASYPNSPDPTPNSYTGNVINVAVGENGTLTYDPPHVSAKPRDTIVFTFKAKNHTVTQSSFSDPCRALALTSPDGEGFDSGFMPVNASDTTGPFPTFNVTVNSTAPMWFFCKQRTATGSHCGAGMVFAVNSDESATSQRTFAAFQTLAKEINGTTTGTSATNGTSGSTTPDSAGGAPVLGASAALTLASVVFGLLLM